MLLFSAKIFSKIFSKINWSEISSFLKHLCYNAHIGEEKYLIFTDILPLRMEKVKGEGGKEDENELRYQSSDGKK